MNSNESPHLGDTVEQVKVALIDGIAVISIDRQQRLNAVTRDMLRAIATTVRAYGDGSRANGIVLTGVGPAFSVGKDPVDVVGEGDPASLPEFDDVTRAVLECAVPTIAAVNGIAVGGAAELTLCFDARLGSSEAAFLFPGNSVGLPVSGASRLLLARLVKPRNVFRLLLESPKVSADEAMSIGLLDDVIEQGNLLDAAVKLADKWGTSSTSIGLMLSLLRPQIEDVERAMHREPAAEEVVVAERFDTMTRSRSVAGIPGLDPEPRTVRLGTSASPRKSGVGGS